MISKLSIVGPAFLILCGIVAVGFYVFALTGHGRTRRITGFVAGFLFTALTIAAVVNAHYEYKSTLGSLWGDIGANVVGEDALEVHSRGTSAPGQPTTTIASDCPQGVPDTGNVVQVQLPGTKSGKPTQDGYVYLPPAWCTNDNTQYPVIMMLHGTPSPEGAKDFAGAMELVKNADEFAAKHGGMAPIFVMPNAGAPNDTECADSKKYGPIETYLTSDVPDFVTSWPELTGRIQPPGKGWAVGGYSMGGTCGLMLTLRHPNVFQTFADYGGDSFGVGDGVPPEQQRTETVRDLFGGDAKAYDDRDPSKLMAAGKLADLGGWFGAGGNDAGTLRDMRRYYDQATKAGMTVCFDVIPDQDHTFIAWKPTMVNSFPWLSARTGLIPMTPEIQATCKTPLGA